MTKLGMKREGKRKPLKRKIPKDYILDNLWSLIVRTLADFTCVLCGKKKGSAKIMTEQNLPREQVAGHYMVQCQNSKDFECPYFETCPHEDKDICQWQLDKADEVITIILRGVKGLVLQAIADEPEYPSDIPDELWEQLDGNRSNMNKTIRLTVRLTKNGITDRFLEALGRMPEEEKIA